MSKEERRELDRASDLLDKGRSDEAIAKLEILRTSSEAEVHDLALNFLANAYASMARNAEAEAMLRQSIEERGTPNDGLGSQLAALAPVVRRQGRNEEAEEIYLRALDVQQPDGPEIKVITMRNLAYLYWCTGRPEKATETCTNLPGCDDGFLDFLAGVMKPYVEPEIPA